MKYGIFGTYLLNAELESFRGLPPVPHGYTLFEVKNDKDVNSVLNMMKIRNAEIDMEYPDESLGNVVHLDINPYECECFLVSLWFTNIFDYWFGFKEVKYISNAELNASFDHFHMCMWCWIKEEITTDELKEEGRKFYNKVMKYNR
jgi:hypothetical protein